jgi:hypothetical protein
MPHSPPQWRGGVSPRELVQQGRGVSPRRMMAPPRRCQSIKCLYPHAGAVVRVRKGLERGGARSRGPRTLERGGASSRGPLSGLPWWAAGPPQRGPCPVGVLKQDAFSFGFFAGFKRDFPSCFRGPSGLSPTVAPEHLRVCQPGSRRCWNLLIGHSSPLVAKAFRGAASADPRV